VVNAPSGQRRQSLLAAVGGRDAEKRSRWQIERFASLAVESTDIGVGDVEK